MAKAKTVFVLQYHHRHGTDVSVYASEIRAKESMGKIMEEYLGEVELEADRKMVETYLKLKEFSAASRKWMEVMNDESFEIDELPVLK